MSTTNTPDRDAVERDALAEVLWIERHVEWARTGKDIWATLPDYEKVGVYRQADAILAAGWSRSPRPANLHPRVQGRCPACGFESLFLGSGGYVTCGLIDCREPHAATTALEPAARPATVSEAAAHLDASLTALGVTDEERTQYCRWAKSAAAVNMSPAVYELAFKIAASNRLTKQDLDRLGEQGAALPHLAAPSEASIRADERTKALNEFADTLGVNMGDDDSEWWQGYRQGQREALHKAAAFARTAPAEDGAE